MKLQSLAVMFIIIILPISIILSSYTTSRVQTLSLQVSYDSKLDNATYDAIKAFQLNTVNSSTSDLANSKVRDIKASVNTFFNSISSNFNLNGYSKESIQNYVPALVYTLYDGYYIYTPYQNTWDQEIIDETNNYESYGTNATYHGGTVHNTNRETLFGLKPYVYYSCRYKNGDIDVVITYSLDTYITIKGKIGSNVVDEKGYLLTSASVLNDDLATYRGVTITTETGLQENAIVEDSAENLLYRKINGVKYYKNSSGEIFYLLNGKKIMDNHITGEYITNNNNSVLYYKNAYNLKEKLSSDPVLRRLKDLNTSWAVDEKGQPFSNNEFGNYQIFDELFNSLDETQIEDSDSNFNSHRLDVIKYSIERNLSIVIQNFNNYSGIVTEFQMPKLKDYEWDEILNNISMISFLQGLNIGGKVYNGYSIVTNNKNEEFVGEDSIYILTNDANYHHIKDTHLSTLNLSSARGYFNMDFERKSVDSSTTGITMYYYPIENVTGCYDSIVNKKGIQDNNIYDILKTNSSLAQIYHTALGRERYGMYRVESIDT